VVLNAGIWELIKDMVIPIDRVEKLKLFCRQQLEFILGFLPIRLVVSIPPIGIFAMEWGHGQRP
jgi:hypothetical protein